MDRVVTAGETMALLRAETLGRIEHLDHLRLGIGGAESNVAVGVVRLGGSARWIGRVGADGLGRRVVRELRAEGVEVCARVDADAPTGLMIKTTPTGGSTRVEYHRAGSAGSRLHPDDLRDDVLADAGVLHVTGITPALSATAAQTVRELVGRARADGVPISFDVNHRSALWSASAAAPVYRELLSQADVAFAGEDEAALIVGAAPALELARRLRELGPAEVVVKRGAAGAVAVTPEGAWEMPAVPVTVVDTVGAGDAFVAGYLFEMLRGGDIVQRLHTAVACGASACGGPGDWESLPTYAELGALGGGGDPVTR